MKLNSIHIQRLRSLLSAELNNCGGFNVLIGKNNAGKSNVLVAIELFFQCIQNQNVLRLNPSIGSAIDFFDQITDTPIEISATFLLSKDEQDILLDRIVSEAPRFKNAIDSITGPLKLSVSVKITSAPTKFAYINEMTLMDASTDEPQNNHIILRIGSMAAEELYNTVSQAASKKKEGNILSQLAERTGKYDWDNMLKSREDGGYLSYFLSNLDRTVIAEDNEPDMFADESGMRFTVSREFRQQLSTLIQKAQSLDEFKTTASGLAEEKKVEASDLEASALTSSVQTFSGEETTIPNYVRSLIWDLSRIKVLYLKESRKAIGREEANRLLSLKVKRGGEQDLKNIKQTVQELLGVQIDAFQSDSSAHKNATTAELDVDNFLVQANGSGIREALRVIFDYEFTHPHILLVEEPETHLHPALETNMMRYLKRISSDCQVFITTHSTNFLDASDMQNVYMVSKSQSTKIQRLDIEGAETQLPKELGLRLSSVFMFDRLVFVEGPSDEAIIREWALTMSVNLSQPNIGFVHMGGVRNFAHYATEATLSFLSKRQVKMIFLIDRDEKEEPEIAQIQHRLGDKAEVRVLQRREIENYLFCSRALAELIQLKLQESGNGTGLSVPTAQEVSARIDEIAETLKQTTIENRVVKTLCQPIIPGRKSVLDRDSGKTIGDRLEAELNRMIRELEATKSKVTDVCKQQSESVDKDWSSNQLKVVQGDILLDGVCKSYGVRFNKVRDSVRLARLMDEREIDAEIKDHIRYIGQQ